MPQPVALPPRFRPLHDSWMLHLRAEGKSPATLTSYSSSIRQFAAWLDDDGTAANARRAYQRSRLPRSWGMH